MPDQAELHLYAVTDYLLDVSGGSDPITMGSKAWPDAQHHLPEIMRCIRRATCASEIHVVRFSTFWKHLEASSQYLVGSKCQSRHKHNSGCQLQHHMEAPEGIILLPCRLQMPE